MAVCDSRPCIKIIHCKIIVKYSYQIYVGYVQTVPFIMERPSGTYFGLETGRTYYCYVEQNSAQLQQDQARALQQVRQVTRRDSLDPGLDGTVAGPLLDCYCRTRVAAARNVLLVTSMVMVRMITSITPKP
jgi:hypothetical protein